ncbi:MAG TPA: caspase family protein [Burkholderiales bacterium]
MSGAKWRYAGAVVAAMILLIHPALADQCDDLREDEPRIVACTQSINSGKWKGRNQAINYLNRGWAYSGKGDYDRAIADYNQAMGLHPNYALAYNNRGLAYYHKGDYDRSIIDYSQAIRIDPQPKSTARINVYKNRGHAYRMKGDYDRAIADYSEAIRLDPKDAPAFSNRADAYRTKGDISRALADYSEAMRLDPTDAYPHVNRGLLHEQLMDYVRARADFSAALELRQEKNKGQHDIARQRLAALPAPSQVLEKSNMATSVVSPPAPGLRNDRRIALVIGNSAYENAAALPNPERDAALVADVLKRTGFQTVSLLTNLRKEALITALRDFAARAELADWAVVYYAGHGMEVGGVNYLVPIDARIAVDRDIGFEAVALEQVLNAAERAKKLRLVVLDACRDNPFAKQMRRTLTVASRSVSSGLVAIEPEAGTLVVFAAKDGETALDGDGINSPFATAFARNLQTPGLEVRRLFDYVRDDVLEATNRKQKPFQYGSISGRQDFYFIEHK